MTVVEDQPPKVIAEIDDMKVIWPCGEITKLNFSKDGMSIEMVIEGHLFTGELRDGKIHWSDGDVWIKSKKQQLHKVTNVHSIFHQNFC